MTAQEILDIINADEDFIYGCSCYGIRADLAGYKAGDRFANSHQWWADDPSAWGEECEYNDDIQMWDGGELDGTCSIGLGDNPTIESIEAAIKLDSKYICSDATTLYLIRGCSSWGGNDIGESIIKNATCVGKI